MSRVNLTDATLPLNCTVLGEKHGKKTELVLIVVVQKFASSQQMSKMFLGQSFKDCPQKDNCGIYQRQENGEMDYSWHRCDGKKRYP